MSRHVWLHESRGGLSSSAIYYFVVDSPLLRHISEYAVQRRDLGDSIEYQIDLNRVRGRTVVEILVSNSGIICSALVYRAEDLLVDFLERNEMQVPLSYLNTFRFSYLKDSERIFLENEWRRHYVPMLLDIRKFVHEFEKLDVGIFMPNLLRCQILSDADYPISYLIPYSEKTRERSLEVLTKFIHQAWVTIKLINVLKSRTHIYIPESKIIVFEQASYAPVALYQQHDKIYSIWWEFDLTPHTMCKGILWSRDTASTLYEYYERAEYYYQKYGSAPLRPDIVVLRDARSCSDILEHGLNILAVFECKNLNYIEWAKKIEMQIKPYAEIFNPTYIFLVSMKPIPRYVKERLKQYGVIALDEVYPGGKGEQDIIKAVEYMLT